jgi:hypothetical protein
MDEEFDGTPHFQTDQEGYPIIKRPTITIPKEIAHEFVQDMVNEVRGSAGDLVVAILIKYYRMKRTQKLQDRSTELPSGDRRRIPVYAPKRAAQDPDQSEVQK